MKRTFTIKRAVAKKVRETARRCNVSIDWLVNWWLKGDARDTLGDGELRDCTVGNYQEHRQRKKARKKAKELGLATSRN